MNQITVLDKGRFKKANSDASVDYEFLSPKDFFSYPANLVTGLGGVSGGRILIGSKATLQAISLVNREAPLVQSAARQTDEPIVKELGQSYMCVRANHPGTVTEVTDHSITIKGEHDETYDLYHNHNLGQKTFVTNYPKVKVGDRVEKGEILATSNYTDSSGTLSMGVNLRTAVMPYRSANFEDAFAVTESGAKKLESEQILRIRTEARLGAEFNKNKYISVFPNKYLNAQLQNIEPSGIIRVGSIVHYGDPLILGLAPKALKSTDLAIGKLGSVLKHAFNDQSVTWDYESPGEVVDVSTSGELVTINLKTRRSLQAGDKISCGFGAKGVAGVIVPDSRAPMDKDGKPVDIILNSMSVTSRVAPALLNALALGKIAQKTNKPIVMPHFRNESVVDDTLKRLKEHGISDTEPLYDPVTGQTTDVLVGPMYFTRLVHIAEDKESHRSTGVGYCFDPETEVLTKRGWLKWPDVQDDDEFYTTHPNNMQVGYYERASKIIRDHYVGKMLGYDGKSVNYLVTPNHNFYVQHTRRGRWQKRTAQEVHRRLTGFKKAGFRFEGDNAPHVLIETDRGLIGFETELIAQLLGYWLTYGSIVPHGAAQSRLIIKSPKRTSVDHVDATNELARRLAIGFTPFVDPLGGQNGVTCTDQGLINYIKSVATDPVTGAKRIPRWLFQASVEVRQSFLESLIPYHAYVFNGLRLTHLYVCYDEIFAGQIQEFCILLGKYAGISPHLDYFEVQLSDAKDSFTNPKPVSTRGGYYEVDYDGMVYCAVVESSHLVYVRRNLKGMLSYQSWDMQPTKADDESSKRLGNLGTSALLSHGATSVLRDIATIKATKNDEFWRRLKLGQPVPSPQVPFIFNKFLASLQGAGINVTKKGTGFQILPMTNNDISRLSHGAIVEPLTFQVKGDKLIPEKGGLFDPEHVGIFGERYNHVELAHSIPNPVSEDFLRKLLNVTKDQYVEMVANGEIEPKLKSINVDKALAQQLQYLKTGKKTKRDDALKLAAFLKTLKTSNLTPADLMLNKVPIIPAMYRPAMAQGDFSLAADVNYLYKDLLMTTNELKKGGEGLPEEVFKDLKLKQYEAVKAVYGLGDPIVVKNAEKGLKGLLSTTLGIKGGSAKTTMFQSKVVNKPMDLVGRAVLTPSAYLDLDEASVPADTLWKVYMPFILRRLVQRGVPATKAQEYVESRNPLAQEVLQEELKHRPAIISRDPSLHKFNLTGFYLKPNTNKRDKTIKLNPLVFKGMAADNDGDQLNINVPASEEARNEVINKMLPSKNLLSPKSFKPMFVPANESSLGLFQMSTEKSNVTHAFNSHADVVSAFNQGKVRVGDQVKLG